MVITGHIQNGAVVLDAPAPLPDGTPVRVEVAETPPPADPTPKTLAERWAKLDGVFVDLPEDAAAQHDHYLYGTPKR